MKASPRQETASTRTSSARVIANLRRQAPHRGTFRRRPRAPASVNGHGHHHSHELPSAPAAVGIRDCAFRDPEGNLIRIQELS